MGQKVEADSTSRILKIADIKRNLLGVKDKVFCDTAIYEAALKAVIDELAFKQTSPLFQISLEVVGIEGKTFDEVETDRKNKKFYKSWQYIDAERAQGMPSVAYVKDKNKNNEIDYIVYMLNTTDCEFYVSEVRFNNGKVPETYLLAGQILALDENQKTFSYASLPPFANVRVTPVYRGAPLEALSTYTDKEGNFSIKTTNTLFTRTSHLKLRFDYPGFKNKETHTRHAINEKENYKPLYTYPR